MTDRDPNARIDELETRLRQVEAELEQLRTAVIRRFSRSDAAGPGQGSGDGGAATEPPPAEDAAGGRSQAPGPGDDAGAEERPGRPAASGGRPETDPGDGAGRAAAPGGRGGGDLERWIGENALLVAGLLALVAAAGFLLKHAFDQGWISPAVRVTGGLLAGLGVAAYGEWARRGGFGRYGGAFVGGGAAIAYLSVWAAAGPYAMVGPRLGLAALAALALLVVASATAAGEPLLAALGALGAFLAPVVLPAAAGSADLLLAYTGLVAAGAGFVAGRRGWRSTFGVAVGGFVVVPAATVLESAAPGWLAVYWTAGGGAALAVAGRRGWRWSQGAVFAAAWVLLLATAYRADGLASWTTLAVAPVLAAASFLPCLREAREGTASTSRRTYLVLSALGWAAVTLEAAPYALEGAPLALLAVLAAAYLVPAVRHDLPVFHATGVGLLVWGVGAQVAGPAVASGWAAVLVLSALLSGRRGLEPARWAGLAVGAAAAGRLFLVDLPAQAEIEPALTGAWSLALYAVVAALALAAGPLWARAPASAGGQGGVRPESAPERGSGPPETSEPPAAGARAAMRPRTLLWSLAGAVVLLGGTVEIHLWFGPAAEGSTALGRDLAVSAFWLAYAGALLGYGFLRERRGVRVAGLVVSAAAMAKIALYDLTRLDALYRVASFVLLAAVALAAARAYHRRAGDDDRDTAPT